MSRLDAIVEDLLVERYSGTWWKTRAMESFAAEAERREAALLHTLNVGVDELEQKRARGRLRELCREVGAPMVEDAG